MAVSIIFCNFTLESAMLAYVYSVAEVASRNFSALL